MANSVESSSGGIGWAGILTIVFITLNTLKLCKVITWSWLWVLSPLWISFGLLIAILLVALIIAVSFG